MKKERFFSIRFKMTVGVILASLVLGSFGIFSVSRIATDIIDKEYSDRAEEIAEAMAATIDPADIAELSKACFEIYNQIGVENVITSSDWGSDAWNEYQAKYDSIRDLPAFIKIQEHLRRYQDIYDVDCIYLTAYRKEVMHAMYLVDGAYGEDECPPGCIDSFEDGMWPDEENPIVPTNITNEEVYGWLVSAAYPVFYDGKLVSHVCVDISMNDIKAKERNYVIETIIVLVVMTLVMLVIVLLYVRKSVIKPVLLLTDTAKNYCKESNDAIHHSFEKLNIPNHDEIGQLLTSMKQMESDMNANIDSLMNTKSALKQTEEKANALQEIAVRDALTGLRNKTAYDHEVERVEKDLAEGDTAFGIAMVDLNFLKRTNDTYGHEKGNISIKKLCSLVCEVFEHSPVFRIGGDEFVVILRNRDFRNIDKLISDFNSHLTEFENDSTLEPWEQISAAIGYARFDVTTDKCVEDVFKKADKAMYDRKTAMKAQRTD